MWQFLVGTCFGIVISQRYPNKCNVAIKYAEDHFANFVNKLEEKEPSSTGNAKED